MKLPKLSFARSIIIFNWTVVPVCILCTASSLARSIPAATLDHRLIYAIAIALSIVPLCADTYYIMRRGREVMAESILKEGEEFTVKEVLSNDLYYNEHVSLALCVLVRQADQGLIHEKVFMVSLCEGLDPRYFVPGCTYRMQGGTYQKVEKAQDRPNHLRLDACLKA